MDTGLTFTVYPKGFLGAHLKQETPQKSAPLEFRLTGNYSATMLENRTSKLQSNQRVMKLYEDRRIGASSVRSFDFRSKILSVALKAFGTDNFYQWYRVQFLSPSFADIHREFIKDTIRFISTGTRKTHLRTWSVIVDARDTGIMDKVIDPEIRSFFRLDQNDHPQANTELTEVIANWCSHEDGINDLLSTLFILYGDAL